MSAWTKNIPTEPGHYWMWTDRPGRVSVPPGYTGWSFDENPGPGLHWRPKPKTFPVALVDVGVDTETRLAHVFFGDGDLALCEHFDAWWIKAEIPEPPKS